MTIEEEGSGKRLEVCFGSFTTAAVEAVFE
jgi:hypothetical protein